METSNIDEKLLKPYNPQDTEKRIYEMWEKSGYFNPDNLPDQGGKPWVTVMPPPNANGRLHAGHGLDMTLKDTLTRFHRMRGRRALFIPGADHAGFETQIVYEKKLEKEGRSRFGMDPKDLYKEILAFTLESKQHMENDVRMLGTSCDWSREKFTLDDDVIKTVHQTFKKMYEDKLLYRGNRIVNWCSKHQTSLSDVETTNKEERTNFYYFKYGPFEIGTARPETKFGDKYVVMHPDDPRYAEYHHGQKFTVDWINGPIEATVIKDPIIDMEFGTGVMTITPWHSGIDFEMAERHSLSYEQIIDFDGKLLPIAGEFAGIHIKKARPLLVEKLKAKGLLTRIDENYVHNIPVCYKCETPIEPQVRPQWFIKMKPLAKLGLKAVADGKINFLPDNFEKIFEYFLTNTTDWNISRQIVWGIPIPAKICDACGHGEPDLENNVKKCSVCGGNVHEDTDTFDTWFSSGQWPLLTTGYPDKPDFQKFYPTDFMETGRDLIFKWVPRMVIFGMYLANEVPFRTVYLHGMVNDEKNQKMSKSKGNVISPIDLVNEFGADATRMGLMVGTSAGMDTAMSKAKIKGYKNFANKVWNIARFVLASVDGNFAYDPAFSEWTELDKKHLSELHAMIREITGELEAYRIHLPAEKVYHYIWHTFADKIIEESKPILAGTDGAAQKSRRQLLMHILVTSLKLLHPFMPFVTEELWGILKPSEHMLMVESWPKAS